MADPQYTLLLVDDNEDNLDMLARRLRKKGYTVRCASSRSTRRTFRAPPRLAWTGAIFLRDGRRPENSSVSGAQSSDSHNSAGVPSNRRADNRQISATID